jgi:hypothetical protein
MAKEAYYFSHDANARQDEKILMLRAEHSWEGYGIYWALIEMMFESSDSALHHNKIKGIAVSYNIDITLLQHVINTCIKEELFTSDNDKFWSESLSRRKSKFLELREKKSEAGKKGMAKRYGKQQTPNDVITEPNKVKESKEKVKDIKISYAEFVTMTEVEHQKLVDTHGIDFTKTCIEVLDNYKGAKGEKYKSDYRAILNWVIKRVKEDAEKAKGFRTTNKQQTNLQLVQVTEEQRKEQQDALNKIRERNGVSPAVNI